MRVILDKTKTSLILLGDEKEREQVFKKPHDLDFFFMEDM
jgi:hypothetical protein